MRADRVTVRLLGRLDRASVVTRPSWWRRLLGHNPVTRIAARDRYGWRWEDSLEAVGPAIALELAGALRNQRGY